MSTHSPIRVLVIEDDSAVAQSVREGLTARGFVVRHAADLTSGRDLLASDRFDALVLDLALPDGTGLEFSALLRSSGIELPILMLTAKDSVSDRVSGFEHGADDYLCKPFDVDELALRLRAILRRTQGGERHLLQFVDVRLDLIKRSVQRNEIKADLSSREADLLAFFMRHPQESLERGRILQEVWGDEAEGESNVVNVYVNYLRNKLEAGLYPRLIHTVRGVGYMLSESDPEEIS